MKTQITIYSIAFKTLIIGFEAYDRYKKATYKKPVINTDHLFIGSTKNTKL